ncbi:MAG: phytanoyl-CoA dioxygenase family protein [Bacteroidota bacterium]
MASLKKRLGQYTGWLRQLKAVYVLNNFLNRDRLQHNKKLYSKYGVKRNILWPIGSHLFDFNQQGIPWLDRPNALATLEQHPDFKSFPQDTQNELRRFVKDGYMVLKGFFSPQQVARHNEEIEKGLQNQSLFFNYTGRKIMEAYKASAFIDKEFFRNAELLRLLNFTMGKKVIPFHTINFKEGSEQAPHSDFIHMTTAPQGYLVAAWTALEDVSTANGTLVFYPGSHRLPYIMANDYSSGNTKWLIGNESNKQYEQKMASIIEEKGLKPHYFEGQAGDVFVWHANLIHGGSPILEEGRTRKSMVAHYFTEEVICFHEMSQRPALISKRSIET